MVRRSSGGVGGRSGTGVDGAELQPELQPGHDPDLAILPR